MAARYRSILQDGRKGELRDKAAGLTAEESSENLVPRRWISSGRGTKFHQENNSGQQRVSVADRISDLEFNTRAEYQITGFTFDDPQVASA